MIYSNHVTFPLMLSLLKHKFDLGNSLFTPDPKDGKIRNGKGDMGLRSLKAKILLSVIIVVVVIEGIFLYLNIRSLSRQILGKTEEEVFNLSETIRLSIRNAMIKDRRDEYQRIIDDVAQRKGIVEVRIFNKQGEITVSSDRTKVGTVVDKQAEACYGCHREGEAKVLLHPIARPGSITQKNRASLV